MTVERERGNEVSDGTDAFVESTKMAMIYCYTRSAIRHSQVNVVKRAILLADV